MGETTLALLQAKRRQLGHFTPQGLEKIRAVNRHRWHSDEKGARP